MRESAIRNPQSAMWRGRSPRCALLAMVLGLALAGGCGTVPVDVHEKTVHELRTLQEVHHKLQQETQALREQTRAQNQRLASLKALGGIERLDRLPHVAKIDLGTYTGGVDTNDTPGHEGIRVYLEPIDTDGDTIKAAGSARVQLYDLAQPPEKNLVGEYHWDVAAFAKAWRGAALTYHYELECPWKHSPPAHKEITVRVEFVELLTGKTFRAQKVCQIDLPSSVPAAPTRPSAASAATAPATQRPPAPPGGVPRDTPTPAPSNPTPAPLPLPRPIPLPPPGQSPR